MKVGLALILVLSTLSAGCLTQYVERDLGSGRRGYYITCGDKFEHCETKARELCAGDFERVSSRRKSKWEEKSPANDAEYTLDVECNEPTKQDLSAGAPSPH